MPAHSKGERKEVLIRLGLDLLADLDEARATQSRTDWIALACQERLMRQANASIATLPHPLPPSPTIPGMDAPAVPAVAGFTHTHTWGTTTVAPVERGTRYTKTCQDCAVVHEETL